MLKLKAKDLRTTIPSEKNIQEVRKRRKEIYFILDSVLDTYNVGGIFRLADAIGVKKVFLCGETETPPNSRIKKASINTTEWVDWEYCQTAERAIEDLRNNVKGIKIVAVEQDTRSTPYHKVSFNLPVAFVVGNESTGVLKEVLDMCDEIAEIPMSGVNNSLNVIVSLAIVSFSINN